MHRDYAKNEKRTHKKKIVCTTGMIASVVKEIVHDKMDVICLMGPGVDPHVYKARPSDVIHIKQADLIVYNGLHLEGKMTELFEQFERSKVVFSVGTMIDRNLLLTVDEGIYDPHIWHDVSLWKEIVMPLAHQCGKILPQERSFFEESAYAYEAQLEQLHDTIKNRCAEIPQEKRILVTAHDAFSYFGRAYGYKVVALQGVSTDAQPGLADMMQLAHYIVEYKISVVFLESCIPHKSMNALVQMVARLGWNVTVGKELLADALGMEKDNADFYIGMIQYNVNAMIEGFAGK
jgi:manganese/zinc/iron transport system substrate-binding protein